MGHSQYDPVEDRNAWNAGRKLGAKRPLKPQQIWAIRFMLDREKRVRDRVLFDLAIDSKLRGCDLVKVRINDLVSGGRIRNRAIVIQQKTKRPVQFELLEPARTSLLAWLERRGGALDNFAFPSRIDRTGHLSTRQYARLVEEWVTGIGLRKEDYGTHSLRRTKASIICKQTGNLRAVQILLGHSKIESTVRYLGVDIEDALALAEGTEIQAMAAPSRGRRIRNGRFRPIVGIEMLAARSQRARDNFSRWRNNLHCLAPSFPVIPRSRPDGREIRVRQ
jgi:integrase